MASGLLSVLISLLNNVIIFSSSFVAWLWLRCCTTYPLPIGAISDPSASTRTADAGAEEHMEEKSPHSEDGLKKEGGNQRNGIADGQSMTHRRHSDHSREEQIRGSAIDCDDSARTMIGYLDVELPERAPMVWSLKDRICMLKRILQSPDTKIPAHDAQIYLASIKGALRLTTIIAIPAVLVLWPIYVTTPSTDAEDNGYANSTSIFNTSTAANIAADSIVIWLLVVFTIVYSLIGYFFAFRFLDLFKVGSLESTEFVAKRYTLLVKGLSTECTSAEVLFNHFDALFPRKVVAAHIFFLNDSGGDFASTVRDIVVHGIYIRSPNPLKIGFVSFLDTYCVTECVSDPRIIGKYYDWAVQRSCSPHEILWDQFHISFFQRACRVIFLNLLLVLVSFIWIPPVSSLQDSIRKNTFALATWAIPLYVFLTNSIIQPYLIYIVSISSGFWKKSSLNSYVTHANHLFLLLNTLLLPFFSIILDSFQKHEQQLEELSKNLWSIIEDSGSLTYQYVVNVAFLTNASQLIQLPQLAMGLWDKVFRNPPNFRKWRFDFGYWYAFNLSILTVTLVYSIYFPLILPWAMLFFSLKYSVDKYNFAANIWDTSEPSGAENVTLAVSYLIASIGFFQFGMAGFFLRKNASNIITLIAILFVFCGLFSWILLFSRRFVLLNKRAAPVSSHKNTLPPVQGHEIEKLKKAYIAPEHARHLMTVSTFGAVE